jgi:hypothetical protein
MAKVKIQGHASGTGVLTVTAPNTSTDRTITLPDATGTLATTADTFDPDGAVVINESGADVDFRVESDNDANSLFVQGSDGSVGMGIGTPDTSTYFGKVLHLAAGSNVGIMFNRTSSTAAKWSVGCNSGGSLVSAKEGVAQLEITSDGKGRSEFTIGAWINFNGQGTVAIRDSHNVSSLSDSATGDYIVYFDTDFGSANIAASVDTGMGVSVNATTMRMSYSAMTAGQYRIAVRNTTNQAWVDEDYVSGMWVGPV